LLALPLLLVVDQVETNAPPNWNSTAKLEE